MIIGIVARMYGPEISTGIGRYIQELISSLISSDHKNQYVIFMRHDM